ncbi:MAG TPA: tail fiber domain-containing protein [Candidatus Udaeobacter sp.]
MVIDQNGKLGISMSSSRFKENINPMDDASEAIFSLKPVTFRYKKELDPEGAPQFGLIAEDVEKVNRNLVVHNKEGTTYSVRYDQVNAMLLNEFLKEHSHVREQDAIIAHQQNQIDALTAELHQVNIQLQLRKTAPQTVLNN